MKKVKILLLFICCLSVLNSCKNDTVSFESANILSFEVNGTEKSTKTPVATLASTGKLQLVGVITGNEKISILINTAAIGSFDVVNDNLVVNYSLDSSAANTYTALAGTVTISLLTDDTIGGTFEFATASNATSSTKLISSGVFKCKYTKN